MQLGCLFTLQKVEKIQKRLPSLISNESVYLLILVKQIKNFLKICIYLISASLMRLEDEQNWGQGIVEFE